MFIAENYITIYLFVILGVTLLTAFVYLQGLGKEHLARGYNKTMLWGIAGILIIFLGTRPISGAFVDMPTYAASYELILNRGSSFFPDIGFNLLSELCALILELNIETFFLVCTAIYVVPLFVASKRVHDEWAFAVFLAFIGAFSFFSYGVNGIRNGLATSLLIAAFAFYDRKVLMAILMVAAAGMHKSVLLPITAFLVCGLFSKPATYAGIWLFCLSISAAFGESISTMLINVTAFGDDERLQAYAGNSGLGADKGGFRWDFILYGIVPIVVSHLFASTAARGDPFYRRILCTYLLSNSFWLLTMYAAFSNRFAYLSWFLMPWVIMYPFIHKVARAKEAFGSEPEAPRFALVSVALLAHFSFTFVMWYYVYGARLN